MTDTKDRLAEALRRALAAYDRTEIEILTDDDEDDFLDEMNHLKNELAAHDAQRAESAADPKWLRDLKHELLRSKMTHNFTLSRDELTHILGGPFALMAQASQGKRAESGAGVDDVDTMVSRFLGWRLPEPWHPDNGISYTRPNFAHEPAEHDWPTGTNLFDADQAREMVLHMLDATPKPGEKS